MGPSASPASELEAQLAREGLKPIRWSNGPDAVYSEHAHPYRKILVVASGSITFTVVGPSAAARRVPMTAGDRLELPAQTRHSALVGPAGVVCVETHV